MEKTQRVISKYRYLWLALFCLCAVIPNLFDGWRTALPHPNQMLLLFGMAAVFAFYLLLSRGKPASDREIVFLILAAGLVLRFVYCAYTDWNIRQHDVGDTEGHMAYMLYIMKGEAPIEEFRNGGFFSFHLPDFDVSDGHWQFYHPPLWHFLCALWMKLQMYLGASFELARENVQVLSLYCSGVILLASHRLFRGFGLRGGAMYLACGLVAFHPTFVILSGSINNDVLSLALTLVSLLLALRWYRSPGYKTILPLALSIGCAMMAKLSAGTVAVAVAFLFLVRFIRSRQKGKMLCHFAAFGAVCVPAALWWQIRNLAAHGVNPLYVPGLSEKSSQYVGFRTTFARLFDISSLFDYGVYPVRATKYLSQTFGFEYYDFNIPLTAFKTSLFGEYYLGAADPFFSVVAAVMFACALAVLAAAAVAAVVLAIRALIALIKKDGSRADNGFSSVGLAAMLVFAATQVVSYVTFCFKFPHFCTMDFRYIALLAVTTALFAGLGYSRLKASARPCAKYAAYALMAVAGVFALCSLGIYGGAA